MYDPARDCFTAAEAAAAAAANKRDAAAASSSVIASSSPISSPASARASLPPQHYGQAQSPTEGMSFDFHGGNGMGARRMSRIDELLSPAPVDDKKGHFRGGDNAGGYSPSEDAGGRLPPPLAEPQSNAQTGGQPEKRKLPSFKRKFDADGGAQSSDRSEQQQRRPPPPGDRVQGGGRYRDRGDERRRSPPPRGGDRDRGGPPPRRRSRSPQQSAQARRDPYASRRRSRSPRDYDRGAPRDSHPPARERERFPRRSRSPPSHLRLLNSALPREPSPPPPPRSPPRAARKLPGRASRLTQAERDAARQAQHLRDNPQANAASQSSANNATLAVEDVVRSHYNEKREMGKQWRVESSRIKGLRSFNNWIKSCVIQKFSPNPTLLTSAEGMRYGGVPEDERLCVLDVGCGKGGDLLKWKLAPQEVGMYVGVDTAEVSVAQARDRYEGMYHERPNRGGGRPPQPTRLFRAEFAVRDCWVDSLGDIAAVREIGWDDSYSRGGGGGGGRWAPGGGFDCVSLMFCMHYAFESEAKCRRMLANVASSLKKGGRFFGTIPSSDVIKHKLLNPAECTAPGEWGNSIYRVKFSQEVVDKLYAPPAPPAQAPTEEKKDGGQDEKEKDASTTKPPPPPTTSWDGRFRPMWGWRYSYFLEEAVEEVPEYVVPWESFRGLCEDYNLECVYKRGFHDIWREEGERKPGAGREERQSLGALSERMGVRDREGRCGISPEEWEACGFYIAFAFRKS
ncbi:mRNA capping enzyme-domain-containing protein [Peziza echinospora]|nr:mRNA capping enzyme-domain-containing protein [Peziza echinospora]